MHSGQIVTPLSGEGEGPSWGWGMPSAQGDDDRGRREDPSRPPSQWWAVGSMLGGFVHRSGKQWEVRLGGCMGTRRRGYGGWIHQKVWAFESNGDPLKVLYWEGRDQSRPVFIVLPRQVWPSNRNSSSQYLRLWSWLLPLFTFGEYPGYLQSAVESVSLVKR